MSATLQKEKRLFPYPCGKPRDIVYTNGVWSVEEGAFQETLFIEVPDGKIVSEPLDIIYQIDGIHAAPWVHIVVGRGSSLFIREKVVALAPSSISLACTVSIGEGGSLSHAFLEPFSKGVESTVSFRAFVERNASLSCISATALPISRKTCSIFLEGESSSADLKALSLAGKDREHENCVTIEHRGEKSSSSQLFKGVVAGFSSVESSVNVRAQGSKSHQLSRFLVVDDRAKTSNKPYLNVFTDDVEATHGATTGQLESEAIWYLKSRGLSEKEARSLCIRGFCKEIIELFQDKDALEKDLEEMLYVY